MKSQKLVVMLRFDRASVSHQHISEMFVGYKLITLRIKNKGSLYVLKKSFKFSLSSLIFLNSIIQKFIC